MALTLGRSTLTPCWTSGAVTMKMTSSTSMTSTIGVTLISDITPRARRLFRPISLPAMLLLRPLLFEVAANALGRAKSLKAADVRDAVAATSIQSVVGPVKWGGQGPFRNVSKTPLVLGQWGKGTKYKVELTLVNNEAAPGIPTGGKLRAL